ncbi:MAG: Uncharacterized protein E1N59_2850 [Puniceicoccaceae bacterium 5H]|nr:MAG: Uncharacterized protein E1N59_2850 [Puniceicoccaceae bacterium 5H]
MSSHAKIQDQFDYLLPAGKEWFGVKEAAAILDLSPGFVRDAFDMGKLCGHAHNGSAAKGREQRYERRIPREFLILYLIETANYDTGSAVQRHLEALRRRSLPELIQIQSGIRAIIQQKQTY